jgi:hypothetical protein
MKTSLIIVLSFVGVFSLLIFLPNIQESYQQPFSCTGDKIPMKNPPSDEIVCISPGHDERKYRSEGYVPVHEDGTGQGTVPSKQTPGQGTIPSWVKNTAAWYGDGSVSQTEFIDAIKHLIDSKVIQLSDVKNIKEDILKSKHKVTITDLRFLECIALHDEYLKMDEPEFHKKYLHKPFINICVNFFNDTPWSAAYTGNLESLYQSYLKFASTDMDKSNFQQCIIYHRYYVQLDESQFLSKFSDKDYIVDCVTLYKDPIWQYDERDRLKQLYLRFVEIESDRTGQTTPSHSVHSEISYIQDLGDGLFEIKFNACAGDKTIHHAKFLIESSTDSVQIGSYKDIQPDSCRTYSSTVHAKNSNDIRVHLMESIEKEHIES